MLTAALNWYRAIPLTDLRGVGEKITVPTMYVWSDGDTALLKRGARNTGRYVSGEYRFETLGIAQAAVGLQVQISTAETPELELILERI